MHAHLCVVHVCVPACRHHHVYKQTVTFLTKKQKSYTRNSLFVVGLAFPHGAVSKMQLPLPENQMPIIMIKVE